MIRRLNYTGRRRILREDIRIIVTRRQGLPAVFKVHLDLSEYDLPADAPVFFEAYRQTSWMRFRGGTVAALTTDEFELTEFGEPEGVLFRVRVGSPDARDRRILAEADHLSGSTEGDEPLGQESLLPVKGEDLGDLVWALEFDDARPLLKINSRLTDWRAAARHPAFETLVLPAALREILREAVHQEGADPDDTDTWWGRWIRFANRLPGMAPFEPDATKEEKNDWVEDAVKAFARRREIFPRFGKFFEGEAEA